MAGESVLDALNSALEENGISSEGGAGEAVELEEGVGNSTLGEGDDSGTADGAEGDDKGADGAEGESGDTEGDAAEGDEGSSEEPTLTELAEEAEKLGISVRDNGKFKSKEQLTKEILAKQEAAEKGVKPAQKKEQTPEEKAAAAKGDKKPADALNDPIDKTLNVRTQERIRTLIDRTKVAEETGAQAQGNFDTFIKGVQATNTSPEQYGETLSFLKLYNSGDPTQQGQALELIENLADQLATMLGRERKVSDPLALHPDLQAAVKAGQTTKALATETARYRNGTQMRTTMQTQAQEQETFQRGVETEKAQGRVDLDDLEKTLRSSDPQYDAKLAIILPAVKVALQSVRPSQWKEAFTKIYREARIALPQRRVVLSKNQPSRTNKSGSVGSGSGAPKLKAGTIAEPTDGAMAALNAALSGGR